MRTPRHRFILINALLLALATLATAACGATASTTSGARAHDFTLRDLEGRTVRLSDYLGDKVVVLNFWATWCSPCLGEMPHLQRIYERYRDQGLVVIAISMDGPETVANVAPAARRMGITYPVVLDEETRVVGTYNPRKDAPFSVVIGRDGVITTTKVGYSAGDEVALEREVQSLLGRPVEPVSRVGHAEPR